MENEQSIAGNNKAKQSDKNNKNKIVKTKKEKKEAIFDFFTEKRCTAHRVRYIII